MKVFLLILALVTIIILLGGEPEESSIGVVVEEPVQVVEVEPEVPNTPPAGEEYLGI